MASLLDPDEQNMALSQGLLGLGAGMLSGSFGHYGAFAPSFGQGAAGFQHGFNSAVGTSLKFKALGQNKLLNDAQIANYNSEVAHRTWQEQQAAAEAAAYQHDIGLDRPQPIPAVNAPPGLMPSQGLQGNTTSPMFAPQSSASALAGGSGPVGGGAGLGATGAEVPIGYRSMMPAQAAPQVPMAPTIDVVGKPNTEAADAYKRAKDYEAYANKSTSKAGFEHWSKKSDEAFKKYVEFAKQDESLANRNQRKPVEGVPSILFDPKESKFYEDGKEVSAARVQELKLAAAAASAAHMTQKVDAYLPASEEAQRDFIKSTRATYDQLKQAPTMIDSIEKAKALIPGAKGFMGPGGESLLDVTKFLNNRLGMSINTAGVKDAEELRTRIFFNIMDNLKKMDAQPSQQQQHIMQEALGKLGTDPGALPRVLDAFEDVIRMKVGLHNNEVRGAMKNNVKFPYDPIITLPDKKVGKAMLPKGWNVEEIK